jgi:hypothetical protein
MARTSATQVEKSFNGGLITDFTALNFPENACTVTQNCVFEPSGRVVRRLGFNFEDDYTLKNITQNEDIVTSFLWKEVNGDGNINLFVVQVGAALYFYETAANSISSGAIPESVDISDYAITGFTDLSSQPCHFTSGKGLLFVTHPQCNPFYVSYIANTIDDTEIIVQIRDFAGVDDTLSVSERPTANVAGMTKEHKYNLYNQGWYFNSAAALTAWDSARTDLPSSSDVWWYFKGTSDAFDTTTIANRDRGNTPAPKGHYIVDAFNIDRTAVSGIASLPVETTNPNRPRVCAFFAGRVWYGGTNSSDTINKLYFSQVVQNNSQVGRCYQQNDPTSESLFDLLPTDGGVIEVSGAGTIYKLFPFGNSLLVFASNGVWAIAGSQGIGFVANDYSVTKISAVEQNSNTSFVSVEGQPFWWTGEAVCTVVTEDNLTFQVQKVSDNKIREFFLNIPEICKQQAVGSFNPSSRLIHWLYRSTEPGTIDEITMYDRVLVLNLLTGAFYIHTIPEHAVKVHSVEMFKGFAGESEVINIEVNGDPVQTAGGDDVVIFDIQGNTSVPVFKYFVSYYDPDLDTNRFTFAEMNSQDYIDWLSYEDADAETYLSEFITGYKIHTEGQRFFQTNYIFVFLDTDSGDDPSCYVQSIYDYAQTGDTGKWSSKQQIYNSNLTDRNVNFRRLKLRGKGRAMQLRFTSEAQRPFGIIGWSLFETANNGL